MAYTYAPHVEFLGGGWRLVRPDGTTLRLPDVTWSVFATLGRGAVGMAGTEAGPLRQVVTGAGQVRDHYEDDFGLAISPDRSIVGWLDSDPAPYVLEGGGTRHFGLPKVRGYQEIDAIAGQRTCQEAYPEGGGCAIFLDTKKGVSVSTSHGVVEPVDGPIAAADVDRAGICSARSRRSRPTRARAGPTSTPRPPAVADLRFPPRLLLPGRVADPRRAHPGEVGQCAALCGARPRWQRAALVHL